MTVKVGTGYHSKDGRRGVANVQMHLLTRLVFGMVWCPEAEYMLRIGDLSDFGRFLLNIIEKLSFGIGLPGQLASVKNDIFSFLANAFEVLLYFYCPPLMITSRQYLNFGEFLLHKSKNKNYTLQVLKNEKIGKLKILKSHF